MQVQFLSRTPKKELSFDAPFGIGGFFFLRVDAKAVDSERRYSTPRGLEGAGRLMAGLQGNRHWAIGQNQAFCYGCGFSAVVCCNNSVK